MNLTKSTRVLLVEDDHEDALIVRRLLKGGGAEEIAVDHVMTVDEAARSLRRESYDAVLIDYRIGPDSGIDLLRDVRSHGITTPAIFLTGQGDEHIAVSAMKAGASDYLIKADLRGDVLQASIRHAAEIRKMQAQAERAAQSLRESEDRFHRAILEAPSPIMIHADDHSVIMLSKAWIELSGYLPTDIPTVRSWLDRAVPMPKREQLAAVMEGLYKSARKSSQGEWPVISKTGEALIWELSSAPLGARADGRRLVITMAVDLTQRKQMEAQFLQAQKMESVGRLAGGVAHDFNNLLTIILGAGDDLLQRSEQEPAMRGSAEAIVKAADRAASLTRQLLLFSRRQAPTPRVVDLNAIVQDLGGMLRRMIPQNVQIQTHLSAQACHVCIDPGQLEQVVMNLAVNAKDAMPGGGTLEIETRHCRESTVGVGGVSAPVERVELALTDTGQGISDAVLPHIFEPFFTTKEEGKGTGLGLSTVYAIVTQAGGTIDVASFAGTGTTFRVTFPPAHPTAAAGRKSERRPEAHGAETILVVDDEVLVSEIVRRALEDRGFSVLEAHDGNTALNICANHPGKIDLIVTDVVLPGFSGRRLFELARALRPEIAVLCMSGYTEDEKLCREVARGRLAFLQKPFTPGDLTRKVRDVLDAHFGT